MHKHGALTLLLALLAPVLGACAPPPPPAAPDGPMPASSPAGPLTTSLQVQTGADSVVFVLQVTNTADAPVELEFSSGQQFDFAVLDGTREVWRWSAERGFTQALGSETVAPGATRTYTASWSPPAGTRGRLTARGTLTARNHRVEQASFFTLP